MDINNILVAVEFIQRELLLFAAIWFLIGAADDLAVDFIWIARTLKRKFTVYRKHKICQSTDLNQSESADRLAIFVPAWNEHEVIGHMLNRCTRYWDHPNYRIYVGCYINDPKTIAVVAEAAVHNPNIRMILNCREGPTTKADCLNRLWEALIHDEQREAVASKAIILHDCEDVVHPDALQVFGNLIGRNGIDMVQLPVVPILQKSSRWVAGHYCDEFAEAHAKQMVVREALGAGVPSAGVGCAFSRSALQTIANQYRNQPFSADSLTEDYELGLKINQNGGRTIFVRMQDGHNQLVATQEFFPADFGSAVRQKARWMTGISLSGWDRLGWSGGMAEFWMRLRDRRAILSVIVLAVAYAAIVLWGILWISQKLSLYEAAALSKPMVILLIANFSMLLWRLGMRAFCVGRIYGINQAFLSIPRSFISNIISLVAGRIAFRNYVSGLFGAQPKWEKTHHQFPLQYQIAPPKDD